MSDLVISQLVLSLFPGLGLLDRAFEAEGFTVVRGPDVLWGGDVRSFHVPRGRFDGIIGGPPCQSFSSLAHLVRANGYEPKFGNLIPEFERVVLEAAPAWFLMEEVPQAPIPSVPGYAVSAFLYRNEWISGEDGFGQEQARGRRFSFGVRDGVRWGAAVNRNGTAPDLRRWIEPAALLLPRAGAVVTASVDNSPEAKGRVPTVCGHDGTGLRPKQRQNAVLSDPGSGLGAERPRRLVGPVLSTVLAAEPVARVRHRAVVGDQRETPVALGGSGKLKPSRRGAIRASSRRDELASRADGPYSRSKGSSARMTLAEMARLQGLPSEVNADGKLLIFEHAPFTADALRKAIANGVPVGLGRAIAGAIRCALAEAVPA